MRFGSKKVIDKKTGIKWDSTTEYKYGLKLKELQEKGVIKDFESYFVEQMLKQVKDTFTSEDEDSTMSQYKDLYMDQAIEMVADEVVDQVGENLTQQLYEQMRRNLNITTTE